jgi:hypothetical protein
VLGGAGARVGGGCGCGEDEGGHSMHFNAPLGESRINTLTGAIGNKSLESDQHNSAQVRSLPVNCWRLSAYFIKFKFC